MDQWMQPSQVLSCSQGRALPCWMLPLASGRQQAEAETPLLQLCSRQMLSTARGWHCLSCPHGQEVFAVVVPGSVSALMQLWQGKPPLLCCPQAVLAVSIHSLSILLGRVLWERRERDIPQAAVLWPVLPAPPGAPLLLCSLRPFRQPSLCRASLLGELGFARETL